MVRYAGRDQDVDPRGTCAHSQKNVKHFDAHATPSLHRAAPLAPLLREQRDGAARGASWDLLVAEHEIQDQDLHDFFPAHTAPPKDASSWDVVLEGAPLDRACEDVCAMLDELDGPPFTVQRLAELLMDPQAHYHTRSKYLAALSRVLAISPIAEAAPSSVAPDTPVFRMRASSEVLPIYSPIPFLAPSVSSAGVADTTPESLGVPPGPIDELDSTEARGVVGQEVHPLSAATHVDIPDKRARTESAS